MGGVDVPVESLPGNSSNSTEPSGRLDPDLIARGVARGRGIPGCLGMEHDEVGPLPHPSNQGPHGGPSPEFDDLARLRATRHQHQQTQADRTNRLGDTSSLPIEDQVGSSQDGHAPPVSRVIGPESMPTRRHPGPG